ESILYLARESEDVSCIVASSEDLGLSPAEIDHLVVRLRGLEERETAALWAELQRLYGEPATALAAAGQTPLQIKQAFGRPSEAPPDDPLGLELLEETELALLQQLCAFRVAVPMRALGSDAADGAVSTLLRRFLIERFPGELLAVPSVVREAMMTRRPASRRHHAHCLRWYRALANEGGGVPLTVRLEELHHAAASGEQELARAMLEAEARGGLSNVVLAGTSTRDELATILEALDRVEELPAPLVYWRARAAMMGCVDPPMDEALPMGGDAQADALEHLYLADRARYLGRPMECVEHAEAAARDGAAGTRTRLWALSRSANALGWAGRMGEALERVGPRWDEVACGGEDVVGLRAWTRGILFFMAGRLGEARDELERAAVEIALEDPSPANASLSLLQVMLTRVQVARGAERPTAQQINPLFRGAPLRRAQALAIHADGLLLRGRPLAALRHLDSMPGASGPTQLHLWRWHWPALRARAERMLGRVRGLANRLQPLTAEVREAGHQRDLTLLWLEYAAALEASGRSTRSAEALEEGLGWSAPFGALDAAMRGLREIARAQNGLATPAAAQAPIGGTDAQALARSVDALEADRWRSSAGLRSRSGLPLAEEAARLAEQGTRQDWLHHACRARLLEAEAWLGDARFEEAAEANARARALFDAHGYGRERLRGALIESSLARSEGRCDAARKSLEEVRAAAGVGGLRVEEEAAVAALARLEGGPVPADASRLGRDLSSRYCLVEPLCARRRTPSGERWLTPGQLEHALCEPSELLIDRRLSRIRVREVEVDLAKRPVLMNVVNALSTPPGSVVSVEQLVHAVWGEAHHPLRHRSRVSVSVARLRRLLGDLVQGCEGGYRLAVVGPWAIIDGA
ncbi:MAG: hypothetical protein OEY14_14865, partial [Myxococcales bacterium]|nr:hypothetical protein [Myxococcales bacterium]